MVFTTWVAHQGYGSEWATSPEGWRLSVIEQGYAGGWAEPVVIGSVTRGEGSGTEYLARAVVAEGAYWPREVRARVELLAAMVRDGVSAPNNFTLRFLPEV